MIIAPEKSGEQNSAYRHRNEGRSRKRGRPSTFLGRTKQVTAKDAEVVWISETLLMKSNICHPEQSEGPRDRAYAFAQFASGVIREIFAALRMTTSSPQGPERRDRESFFLRCVLSILCGDVISFFPGARAGSGRDRGCIARRERERGLKLKFLERAAKIRNGCRIYFVR